MKSTFVAISIVIKSNIGEKCLINFLINVSSQSWRDYLEFANIYNGNLPKKKSDLTEMVVYGCITEKLNKKETEDISMKQVNQILK